MKIKQALIFRMDLPMTPGKMVAQGAHGAIGAFDVTPYEVIDEWNRQGTTKIVLAVPTVEHLLDLQQRAVALYVPNFLVWDEGRTEVPPGSITCLAIGPGKIDDITRGLPLY
jgi:PTH2 family peptidyl-tRNA hydrolase